MARRKPEQLLASLLEQTETETFEQLQRWCMNRLSESNQHGETLLEEIKELFCQAPEDRMDELVDRVVHMAAIVRMDVVDPEPKPSEQRDYLNEIANRADNLLELLDWEFGIWMEYVIQKMPSVQLDRMKLADGEQLLPEKIISELRDAARDAAEVVGSLPYRKRIFIGLAWMLVEECYTNYERNYSISLSTYERSDLVNLFIIICKLADAEPPHRKTIGGILSTAIKEVLPEKRFRN